MNEKEKLTGELMPQTDKKEKDAENRKTDSSSGEKTPDAISQVDAYFEQQKEANKTISLFAASAAATSAIPVPFADAPALIAEQTAMLAAINKIYGVSMRKNALRTLTMAVLGVSSTTLLGKTITGSLFKLIPGIGSVGGAAVCAATAGALTIALGKAYRDIVEKAVLENLAVDFSIGSEERKMLEIAFKEYLRLEMKKESHENQPETQDVLVQREVPTDTQVIYLSVKEPDDSENRKQRYEIRIVPEETTAAEKMRKEEESV